MAKRKSKRGISSLEKNISFAFADIRLVDCHCKQSLEAGQLPTNSQLTVQVQVAIHRTDLHSFVRPTVIFAVWYDEKLEGDPAISVSITFQLQYQYNTKPTDQKQLRQTLTQLAMLHSWPYFRELLQSQINRMGLPPMVLPLLAMPPSHGKSLKKRARPK